MARTPKVEEPAKGLYKNGARWWIRSFRAPLSGRIKPVSTGTSDAREANRVKEFADMLRDEQRAQWDLLERVADGELTLNALFKRYASGQLDLVRAELATAQAASRIEETDPDLVPFVEEWVTKHLATLTTAERTRQQYARQVRAIVGSVGAPAFRRSQWTEDELKARLFELRDPRRGNERLSGSGRRRYYAALQLFHKWARKRVPLTTNPFEDAKEWRPTNNDPRTVWWDHETRMKVINAFTGEQRVFAAAIFGAGLELTAALALTAGDIGREDDMRQITAHGTKNESRAGRRIFMDEWAWQIVAPHARALPARASLWSSSDEQFADAFRDRLYALQVELELCDAPARSEDTGKLLWGELARAEKLHTVHDARHTYVACRLLGLDGEQRQDIKFCADQLGHTDEQMVMRVYAKAGVAARLRLIALREAQAKGLAEGRRQAAEEAA